MIKAYTADMVFPGNSAAISNGVVEFINDGHITHIGSTASSKNIKPEKLDGIICPAFINTHCHIELSHLKGQLHKKTGLNGFINELQKLRHTSIEKIESAILAAEEEMKASGIVAVGDISNSSHSFELKKRSKIYFHTFIELFGFDNQKAEEIFYSGKQLENELRLLNLNGNLSPHSPYSVSTELMKKIVQEDNAFPLSIHNQETEEENKMFLEKTGKMVQLLQSFQMDVENWKESKTTSIKAYLNKFPKNKNLLLVHNTFTSIEDIAWAEKEHARIYWCFCPKANMYIEGKLPIIEHFAKMGVKCTLGTDSLASNDTLSILEEMKCIQQHFPKIPLSTLIQWSSYNAAEFLSLQDQLGSIEVGKKPGLLCLKNVRDEKLGASTVSRII